MTTTVACKREQLSAIKTTLWKMCVQNECFDRQNQCGKLWHDNSDKTLAESYNGIWQIASNLLQTAIEQSWLKKCRTLFILDDHILFLKMWGFNAPLKSSETTVPCMYKKVNTILLKHIENIEAMSFTADVQSLNVCLVWLPSLTANWID